MVGREPVVAGALVDRMAGLNQYPDEQREQGKRGVEMDGAGRFQPYGREQPHRWYTRNLYQDVNNRRMRQARMAMMMSRFSPASSYQLAAMASAGTDPDMKQRYESEMDSYRERYAAFLDEQRRQTGQSSAERVTFSMGGGAGFNVSQSMNQAELDVASIPVFTYEDFGTVVNRVFPDFLVMLFVSSMTFLGASTHSFDTMCVVHAGRMYRFSEMRRYRVV